MKTASVTGRGSKHAHPDVDTYLRMSHIDYASTSDHEILKLLRTSMSGISEAEAGERLRAYGPNEFAKKKKSAALRLFGGFANPLVIVLFIIATFSFFTGDRIGGGLVYGMAAMAVLLSFIQEYRAGKEAEKLSELVHPTATVYRNRKLSEIKLRRIVPGDVVYLSAGDIVPADLRLVACKDLHINQAAMTGESFPVEKSAGPLKPSEQQGQVLANIAYMGSSVVSGTALGVVIKTGSGTQFGELTKKLSTAPTATSFDKGVRKFTWVMIRFMILLVAVIFVINVLLKRNLAEAFFFSLAVAVGLTPEMLPMIITLNLTKGAIAMSKKRVIVKRLNSMQNFGAMDILCTDKTGTLTLGEVILEKHLDVSGKNDESVLQYAYLNSYYQTGLKNLLDTAILKRKKFDVTHFRKIDEMPFDFSRKRMSVVVSTGGRHVVISKGAPEELVKRCSRFELNGKVHGIRKLPKEFRENANRLREDGFRVLAVAYKEVAAKKATYTKDDETALVLKGYVAFLDPPKPSAKEAVTALEKLGIGFKVLTGDNEIITKKVCTDVGLDVSGLVTGDELEKLSDNELRKTIEKASIFARLTPFQKERIIRALQKNGHVVGYLGDGINDAPALKASDVGISVKNAVDIAKETADIILLEKHLNVLHEGVVEGRKTFGNITKYVRMGASSNFGNMISMTGASLLLPFLPMLPIQILLNNFLYDISQVAIPTDEVDADYTKKPRPWDFKSIVRFMLVFGPVSSLFDFITYGVLLLAFHAAPSLFHTGWFLESLLTQTLVIHVIRTAKIPFIRSVPSKYLIFTSILIALLGFVITQSSLAKPFSFVHLPAAYILAILLIVGAYLVVTQFVKVWFVRKYGYT